MNDVVGLKVSFKYDMIAIFKMVVCVCRRAPLEKRSKA